MSSVDVIDQTDNRRYIWLDILKAICAFLIVCIHKPFPGKFGEYFTALARVAVPIFFMITGFFYRNTVSKGREGKQIKKIICLIAISNVLFFAWNIILEFVLQKDVLLYIKSTFTISNLIRLLVFNYSPFGSHLWYLNALLYVYFITHIFRALNIEKLLFVFIPVLLAGDLIFGKYSLLIFRREIPYLFVRNFLFVGIPYFSLGILIYDAKKFVTGGGKRILYSYSDIYAHNNFGKICADRVKCECS